MRSTFHCPRWPGCCPDGAVRHDCPALADMMRRESDTGNWLDRFCEWAVSNPWRICAVICACIVIVSLIDGPVS